MTDNTKLSHLNTAPNCLGNWLGRVTLRQRYPMRLIRIALATRTCLPEREELERLRLRVFLQSVSIALKAQQKLLAANVASAKPFPLVMMSMFWKLMARAIEESMRFDYCDPMPRFVQAVVSIKSISSTKCTC